MLTTIPLPFQHQASIMMLKADAVARLLGQEKIECKAKLYQQAVNMTFESFSQRNSFLHDLHLESLRLFTANMWRNLTDYQQTSLRKEIGSKVNTVEPGKALDFQLETNLNLSTDDIEIIQKMIMSKVLEPAPKEEQTLFSYSQEVYDNLANKVSERGYMRLFYVLHGSKCEPAAPPKGLLLAAKYFTDRKNFEALVTAIQLEVKRTELGKKWQASPDLCGLIPHHYVTDKDVVGWWDADSLTQEQVEGYLFKANMTPTKNPSTMAQRIVSLLHLVGGEDPKSKIMAVMMAHEAWVCDPLDGVWRLKKELLAKKVSSMTEQELGKWETFKDPIVDEVTQRRMTDGQKQILEGLMIGDAFRTQYWFEYFGYRLVNMYQKQRIIVLEYLRSLPKL